MASVRAQSIAARKALRMRREGLVLREVEAGRGLGVEGVAAVGNLTTY